MARLVLPVGHYMGQFYAEPDGPLKYHIVRVGRRTTKLPDDAHMAVWGLLHSPSVMIDAIPTVRLM